jgi:hypothetical protein
MRGIVWGKTIERGREKLEEIVDDYIVMGHKILEKRVTKHHTAILFDNGDYWQAVRTTESSARGQRCNVSYIDHELEKYISIIESIKAGTTVMPFNGITYF